MNITRTLRAVWNPDMYHGWGQTRSYFEGWYLKIVSPDGAQALAVIPGISMDTAGNQHAFIQVMDGTKCIASYHEFEAQDFQPSDSRFELRLGGNYFSSDRMTLDLPGLKGTVYFKDINPWPSMLGAPGIMGWYSFVPFMQCNHGVVSVQHYLEGTLLINGVSQSFEGGKGYIEKDWGSSFPKAYVWMQSNHFDKYDRASLLASVAHIPWLGTHFIGFISGFWLDGQLYKFATYTGAKKRLYITDETVELIYKGPSSELRIMAQQAAGTALISPLSGAMTGKINESLQATLEVELLVNGKTVFHDTGRHAGLEIAGAIEVLVDTKGKERVNESDQIQ